MKCVYVSGQFDLFGLSQVEEQHLPKQQKCESEEYDNSVKKVEDVDYLKREERILSLLRERDKKERTMEFQENEFLENINFKTYEKKELFERLNYLLQRVRTQMIRPLLSESNIEKLLELLPYPLPKVSEQLSEYERKVLEGVFWKNKEKYTGCAVFSLQDESVYFPLGGVTMTPSKSGRRYYQRGCKDKLHIDDGGLALAPLVLMKKIREQVQKVLNAAEDKTKNPVYELLNGYMEKFFEQIRQSQRIGVFEHQLKHCLTKAVLDEAKVDYEVIVSNKSVKDKHYDYILREKDLFAAYFLSEDEIPWSYTLDWYGCSYSITEMVCGCMDMRLFVELVDILFDEYIEDRNDFLARKRMMDDYALSFETKKNIPKHVLKAMETSEFNNNFGYVEFDSDVDIAKTEELYKEFKALADFLGLQKFDDVSLRFRRLGHHKASGLYYYFKKCLCVDIRTPSSFSHEIMHMIDYERGHLSRNNAFRKIILMYRAKVNEAMLSNNAVRDKLEGGTKFNKSYYFNASEIFARCGEIYLTRYCGIENSLVKPDYEQFYFAYPKDELLEAEIAKYYNALFAKEEQTLSVRRLL